MITQPLIISIRLFMNKVCSTPNTNMNLKHLFLSLLTLLTFTYTQAQKENNIWVFGNKEGLDFNSGSPVLISSMMDGVEGVASVCNADGELLFYSNGNKVWDRTHKLMPNGTGLNGNQKNSCTQGVNIAQFVNNPDRYYVFTADAAEHTFLDGNMMRLYYTVVDMKLNGGLGDVVTSEKNIVLDSNTTESVTLAKGKGCYLWLLVHLKDTLIGSNQFDAFKIDAGGINKTPVVSNIGTKDSFFATAGDMKVDPTGKHLFRSTNFKAELFDFDNSTGIVSNPRNLSSGFGIYSSCFSPDGSKLYHETTFLKTIVQYDLSLLPSLAAVKASETIFADSFRFIAEMRIGPDGKIYIAGTSPYPASPCLIIINDPNKAGAACNITFKKPLKMTLSLGEPAMVAEPVRTTAVKYISGCIIDTTIVLPIVPFENIKWSDGDTSHIKTLKVPDTVWLATYKACEIHTDTMIVERAASMSIYTGSIHLALCKGTDTTIILQGKEGKRLLWNDNDTSSTKKMSTPGIQWLTTIDGCKLYIDTFIITTKPFDSSFRRHLLTSCTTDDTLVSAPDSNLDFTWNDGDTATIKILPATDKVWVKTQKGCLLWVDTFQLQKKPIEILYSNRDTVLCASEKMLLQGINAYDNYLWRDNTTASSITVKDTGTYWYIAGKYCAILYDTIHLSTIQCTDCIAIPNAFTPNNDNRNDKFGPLLSCPVSKYSIIIYNRFGELVFKSEDPENPWDGKFNQQELNAGVYYYMIKVYFNYPGVMNRVYKGDVSLVR